MNYDLLEKKISDSGMKKSYLAEQIDKTPQAFRLKLQGKSQFTVAEVTVLKDCLDLSDADIHDIFNI